MAERQKVLGRILSADPDVATVGMAIGATSGQTLNNGRMFVTLKPRSQRTASASQVIDRLRPKLAQVEGAALFLQPAQDINVGGRLSGPSTDTRYRRRRGRTQHMGAETTG